MNTFSIKKNIKNVFKKLYSTKLTFCEYFQPKPNLVELCFQRYDTLARNGRYQTLPTTMLQYLYLYWSVVFMGSDCFHVSKWASIDEFVFHHLKTKQNAYRKMKMKQKHFSNRITAIFERRIKSELI